MKIKITYERDGKVSTANSYWAKTKIKDGLELLACADSWEAAKTRLLGKVEDNLAMQRGEVPADEEIEI